MEREYANYDLFDKLIVNEKKAKQWTLLWITILCILSIAIIVLAINNSNQRKAIIGLNDNVTYRQHVIDSLNEVIKKQVSRQVDSITRYVDTISSYIGSVTNDIKKTDPAVDTVKKDIVNPSTEFNKEDFTQVSRSIAALNSKIQRIKTDIQQDRLRIFIQYNNAGNSGRVNELISYLSKNADYFIAPPELVNGSFKNQIKIYNYNNEADEKQLNAITSKIFGLPPGNIIVSHPPDPSQAKPTIEIWIGNGKPVINTINSSFKKAD